MRKNFFLIFFSIFSISLFGQKIVFSPQWISQAQFAGYYVALEKGFYADAGLDVEIVHPSVSNSVIDRIKNKESDFVTLQLIEAMKMEDNGVPLVNLMQSSQNSSLTIIAQPQYTKLSQLDGKRVGGWKSGFCDLAFCLAKDNHHDIEWVRFAAGVNLFTSKAVDAILAMEYNEMFLVMNAGQHVTEKNIFYFNKMNGYNIPEDGLYCRRDVYENNKAAFDAFVEASKKGWMYAHNHPEEALDIVIKTMKKDKVACSMSHQEWMLNKILNNQIDSKTNSIPFVLKKEVFEQTNDMLLRNDVIKTRIDYNVFCK